MATRLNNWPGHADGKFRYPWDEWLDGSAWQLTPGEDFTCPEASFRRTAYGAANARGGKARTSISDGRFILQFVPRGTS